MTSLRSRLTIALTLVLVVAAALLVLGLQRFARELVDGYVVARLEHDAEMLYARLADTADPSLAALDALGPVYRLPLSGHYFRIEREPRAGAAPLANEIIRSRSLWDEDLAAVAVSGTGTRVQRVDGPAGQTLLSYTRHFAGSDAAWLVTVAEDVSGIQAAVRRFRRWLIAGAVLSLLALAWVQRRLVLRGLAPLDSAVEACERLERGESVPVATAAPDEVRPMLDAVNRLVYHQTQRLARVRHAAGNLSHALKTPLTVLGQIAEQLATSGGAGSAAAMRVQLGTMRETIEREMRRARLAGSGIAGEGFEARSQLAELVHALQRLHADRGLRIELVAPERRYALDREDMLELFGNLLDNACKWAASHVRVAIADDASALRFEVDDDGPGVDDTMMPRLGTGAVRADESRPGHGLGLTIVADIVAQYGGTIAYRRSPTLGGLQASGILAPAGSRR